MSFNSRKPLVRGTELILKKDTDYALRILVEQVICYTEDSIAYIGKLCNDTKLHLSAGRVVLKEFYPILASEEGVYRNLESGSLIMPDSRKKDFIREGSEWYDATFPFVYVAQTNNTIYTCTDANKALILSEWKEIEGSITRGNIAQVMLLVCEYIQKIHESGGLYLNCSPESIYFTGDFKFEKASMFDFTAVKSRKNISDYQYDSCMDGWAPLEQFRGEKRCIDVSADIYAVGAVFLWLLTGKRIDIETDHDDVSSEFLWSNFSDMIEDSDANISLIRKILVNSLHNAWNSRYINIAAMKKDFDKLARRYAKVEEIKVSTETEVSEKSVSTDYNHTFERAEFVWEDQSMWDNMPYYNGSNSVECANGDYYDGEWNRGKFHGIGVYKWKDGKMYEGEWKDGIPEGKGRYIYSNGDVYEGYFSNGKIAKEGKLAIVGREPFIIDSKHLIYTDENPAVYPIFNSITNNPTVGDERDFVRIEEKNSGRPYSSEIVIEAGKEYEVYIYYCNDALDSYNKKAQGYTGVAYDVRLACNFPNKLAANERAAVTGKITASNTFPKVVWNQAYITAKQSMTLHYVTGSAKIYNKWNETGTVLSANLFSPAGTLIGLAELNGVILGGSQYAGYIVYTIRSQAVKDSFSQIFDKKEIRFKDGRVYIGEESDGLPNGIGKMIYPDGDIYEGSYVNGKKEGKGTYFYADKSVYEGDYVNGREEGKGKHTYVNGNVYEGDYVNGKREGIGKFIFYNGAVYEGEWVKDKYEGKGKITLANGDTYEGEWLSGKRHGQGVFTVADSGHLPAGEHFDNGNYDLKEKYVGTWKKGRMDGNIMHYFMGIPQDLCHYDKGENIGTVLCTDKNLRPTEDLEKKDVIGYYFGQSAFWIETPSSVFLFDWYMGILPGIPKNKRIYIFVSHTHTDHFSKDVSRVAKILGAARIFIGYDGNRDTLNDLFSPEINKKVFYVHGGQNLDVDNILEVSTLPSTDLGVAFLVQVDGVRIFHAGDLAVWSEVSQSAFEENIKGIEEKHIDYAMLPLDPRKEDFGERTVQYYMSHVDIDYFTPMHLWGNYEYINTFLNKNPAYAGKMLVPYKTEQVAKANFSLEEFYEIPIEHKMEMPDINKSDTVESADNLEVVLMWRMAQNAEKEGNTQEAIKLYELIQDGAEYEKRARMCLAKLYSDQPKRAFECYYRAASLGDAWGQYVVGDMYSCGKGVPQNYSEAMRWFKMSANQGDPMALFNVGHMYENGRGVPSDRSEAIKWYQKAAEKGHDGAKDRLLSLLEKKEEQLEISVGRRISEGMSNEGLTEFEFLSDSEEIATCLRKHVPNYRIIVTEEKNKQKKSLAENAQKELASGETCEKRGQLEAAFRHYCNAADFGDAKGAFYVGYMYEHGEGVQRNIKSAVEWYTKSAEMGNRGAQHNLGFFYYSGTGVEQNLKLAYEFFMMAAKQGKVDSMLNIGVMYENGEYVAKDYHKALEWYRKAADNGNSDGERFYNALQYRMLRGSH